LLNRALEEGGVNYGNRRIFGVSLEPIPGPTAVMLLALQGHADDARIGKTVTYLCQQAESGTDLEHLCWARLALDAHRGRPGVEGAVAKLGERVQLSHAERSATPYVRPHPLRQALTALALGLDRANPFRLGEAPASKPLTPATIKPRKPGWGESIKGWFRGLAINAETNLKQLAPQTQVHIAPAAGYNEDLADVVCRQYEHFRERVPLKGKRVVLKP